MGRFREMFMDPEGATFGIPTYAWKMAPDHLLTLRQLRKRGLRPGGPEVQAQIAWTPTSMTGLASPNALSLSLVIQACQAWTH